VSDCSGYFFAKQKSLSEKRDAAGLPAGARPNMQAKIIRQKSSGKKHQAKNKVLSICEKFRGTAFFNHTTPATPTF
jgi:hypothetical protein